MTPYYQDDHVTLYHASLPHLAKEASCPPLKYSQLPSPGLAGRGGRLPRSGKRWVIRAGMSSRSRVLPLSY